MALKVSFIWETVNKSSSPKAKVRSVTTVIATTKRVIRNSFQQIYRSKSKMLAPIGELTHAVAW